MKHKANLHKQTVVFAVETEKGNVQKIGKAVILQPKIRFNGGTVKWYEDKIRK